MKKILILVSILCLITGGSFFWHSQIVQNMQKLEQNKKNTEMKKENRDQESIEAEQREPVEVQINENEKKKETVPERITEKEIIQPENDKSTDYEEKSVIVEQQELPNTSVQESKPQTEWEKLGMSEYDYYYSLTWNWQTVTFGIYMHDKKCSNESECRNACRNYGSTYLETYDGGFRCNSVNSRGGIYLGEEFEFFQLQL